MLITPTNITLFYVYWTMTKTITEKHQYLFKKILGLA